MLRIVIDVNTPAGYAQAVKEDLAMHLERWAKDRIYTPKTSILEGDSQ